MAHLLTGGEQLHAGQYREREEGHAADNRVRNDLAALYPDRATNTFRSTVESFLERSTDIGSRPQTIFAMAAVVYYDKRTLTPQVVVQKTDGPMVSAGLVDKVDAHELYEELEKQARTVGRGLVTPLYVVHEDPECDHEEVTAKVNFAIEQALESDQSRALVTRKTNSAAWKMPIGDINKLSGQKLLVMNPLDICTDEKAATKARKRSVDEKAAAKAGKRSLDKTANESTPEALDTNAHLLRSAEDRAQGKRDYLRDCSRKIARTLGDSLASHWERQYVIANKEQRENVVRDIERIERDLEEFGGSYSGVQASLAAMRDLRKKLQDDI